MLGIGAEQDAVDSLVDAQKNKLKAAFSTLPIQRVSGSYALIVANLYAKILIELKPDLLRLLDGHMALAGILVEKEDQVLSAFEDLNLFVNRFDGDWVLWFTVKDDMGSVRRFAEQIPQEGQEVLFQKR